MAVHLTNLLPQPWCVISDSIFAADKSLGSPDFAQGVFIVILPCLSCRVVALDEIARHSDAKLGAYRVGNIRESEWAGSVDGVARRVETVLDIFKASRSVTRNKHKDDAPV